MAAPSTAGGQREREREKPKPQSKEEEESTSIKFHLKWATFLSLFGDLGDRYERPNGPSNTSNGHN